MFFTKKAPGEEEIRKTLGALHHSGRGHSFAELGLVEGVVVKEGEVTFVLQLLEGDQAHVPQLREIAENAVKSLPGVKSARAVFTAAAKPAPRKAPSGFNAGHLGKIIAVLSGKGGVGKSTVAANLACALAKQGLRVGLLDADIYGPSVPRLFGLRDKPQTANNKMVPPEKFGLKVMSIGFVLEEDMPVIWRGPVVQKAIRQLIEDVAWGPLDVLVIDMPPGTGDVQLTFAQSTPLAGGVIVSTPQDLALIDARKAIAMLKRLDVPVLGILENMSGFACPHCGERSDIFGAGGAKAEADKIGEEFLGAVPLDINLRKTSDEGAPITVAEPASPLSEMFSHIAARIWQKTNAVQAKVVRG
ncbi:MAG TPA: Mrp/NBP35 family ATP-binding protein [Alphaproteobacteria bacterium]|nr:Mrp/NBP35 family ATP-binding protein [Alphaproteobacteria bacterium]